MPPGFNGHSAARTDVWVPIHAAMPSANWDSDRFRNITAIVVRLTPGVSPAAASAQATGVVGRRISLWPVAGGDVTATERRMAWWLSGISALVLVIGLANTATLLLVRGAARRRDLAIRTTLGATRGRLAMHVLVEAALITTAATAAAAITAAWLDDAVRRVLLPSIGDAAPIGTRLVLATAATGVLAFVVSGVAGLLLMPDGSGQADLAVAIRRRPRRHLYTGLLMLQTTLCVVLLAGAGLFGRSFYKLISQDFGMRTDGVLLVRFEPGAAAARQDELFESALGRIRALPGVAAATSINTIPFTGFNVPPISVPGLADPPSVDGQLPFLVAATPALFDVLGLQVVEGRPFDPRDDRGAPVVIVNQTMARTVWPGQPAIGRCIRIGFDPTFDPFAGGPPAQPTSVACREVVGVMRDVRQRSVIPTGHEDRLMQYLVPFSQVPGPPSGIAPGPQVQGLLLRIDGDPARSITAVRQALIGTRTDLPFLQIRPYAELLNRQMEPWRLATALLVLFGALALSVAAVGLYAAFAHSIGERRHEMAVRLAVGANPARVLVMVLREAAVVAVAGIVAGSALAVLGGRSLSSMLFDTAPADPLVLAVAAAVMLSVSAAATFLPARTAAQTDPTSLLRSE
jgi:predicted permease